MQVSCMLTAHTIFMTPIFSRRVPILVGRGEGRLRGVHKGLQKLTNGRGIWCLLYLLGTECLGNITSSEQRRSSLFSVCALYHTNFLSSYLFSINLHSFRELHT